MNAAVKTDYYNWFKIARIIVKIKMANVL